MIIIPQEKVNYEKKLKKKMPRFININCNTNEFIHTNFIYFEDFSKRFIWFLLSNRDHWIDHKTILLSQEN